MCALLHLFARCTYFSRLFEQFVSGDGIGMWNSFISFSLRLLRNNTVRVHDRHRAAQRVKFSAKWAEYFCLCHIGNGNAIEIFFLVHVWLNKSACWCLMWLPSSSRAGGHRRKRENIYILFIERRINGNWKFMCRRQRGEKKTKIKINDNLQLVNGLVNVD